MYKGERLICRTCGGKNYMIFMDIFERYEEDKLLSQRLMEFTNLKVEKQDELPRYMCKTCVETLISAQQFKLMAVDSALNFEEDQKMGSMPLLVKEIQENTEESETTEVVNVNEKLSIIYEEPKLSCVDVKNSNNSENNTKLSEIDIKELNSTGACSDTIKSNIGEHSPESGYVFNEKRVPLTRRTDEQPYRCNICGKQSKTKSVIKEHLPLHNKDKWFTCEHCGKYFGNIGAFWEHRTTYMMDRTCKCLVCNKKFSRLKNLKRHQQLMHTHNKAYTCDNAGEPPYVCEK